MDRHRGDRRAGSLPGAQHPVLCNGSGGTLKANCAPAWQAALRIDPLCRGKSCILNAEKGNAMPSFEESLKKLETIVEQLEKGDRDPQKLCGELVLRNWRAGDGFCPAGSRGVRKLKELFRERKIPEVQRKSWPVLLCVCWVVVLTPSRPKCTPYVVWKSPKTYAVRCVEESQNVRCTLDF